MATAAGTFRLEVSYGDSSFSAEGDSNLVMRAFETFRQDLESEQGRPRRQKPDASETKDDETEEEAGGGADPHAAFAKGKPLSAFLKEKNPKTNDSAVAVMAIWANANQGTTEFTVSLIEDLWSRSGRKKPKNVPRDMAKAASNGWLDKSGRAKYTLPSYGIDFVRGLPADRE